MPPELHLRGGVELCVQHFPRLLRLIQIGEGELCTVVEGPRCDGQRRRADEDLVNEVLELHALVSAVFMVAWAKRWQNVPIDGSSSNGVALRRSAWIAATSPFLCCSNEAMASTGDSFTMPMARPDQVAQLGLDVPSADLSSPYFPPPMVP